MTLISRFSHAISGAMLFMAFDAQAFHANAPTLEWRPCYQSSGQPFECSVAHLPLEYSNYWPYLPFGDYNNPNWDTVGVHLIRLPATDPAQRKGSLFFNPGGPSGSGFAFIQGIGPYLYTDEVRAQYDLIGFDPRGTNRSLPLVCADYMSEMIPLLSLPRFPITDAQVNTRRELEQEFSDRCFLDDEKILGHMATVDVAKDLEILRRAVGDSHLNFVGYSYGSYLGVVYANMFPTRVGKLVVDGVLDPIAWSRGRGFETYTTPFSTRLRSDKGAQDTLNEFLRLCDQAGASGCAFAGNAAARYDALAQLLRAGPLDVVLPNGRPGVVTYQEFISATLTTLYQPSNWAGFAASLAGLELFTDTGVALEASNDFAFTSPAPAPQTLEGFYGVACSDSSNPKNYDDWVTAAEQAESEYGYFALPWTWVSSVCESWPTTAKGRFNGYFGHWTATPILVVSTLFDPATAYEGAQVVDRLMPRSRLLTINGWGHTSLFLSQCGTQAVSDYLTDGVLPAIGAVCQQDVPPFNSPVALAERLSDTQAAVSAIRRVEPSAPKANADRIRSAVEKRREAMKSIMPLNLR